MARLLTGVLVWGWLLAAGCAPPATRTPVTEQPAKKKAADVSAPFFTGEIRQLHLAVKPQDAEKINREGRPWVKATLTEKNGQGETLAVYKEVAIKLKGAAGSFQHFGDRPALTVRLDKFGQKNAFHGMAKFHLNNSVQDETYLHEQLCSEIFTAAGIPATRVTHARLWLNTRDVGLYVLKEGFDERFLERHFGATASQGNLYDGGFCTDLDAELEKDCGQGPDDFSDLLALREACQQSDEHERNRLLAERLDVPAFLKFTALELMTCHWDGYVSNRNNYRLYFEPSIKKAYFFPHGMDQMFGDPGFSVVQVPGALVAQAVMANPAWREDFKREVNVLLPQFSPPDKLLARVESLRARLQPTLAAMDANLPAAHEERVNGLKEAIRARAASLEEQKSFPDPSPEEFSAEGVLPLADWHPAAEVEDALLEMVDLPEEKHALRIAVGPSGQCVASWRRTVLLAPGKYAFIAKLKTQEVETFEDERGLGAGLRSSGANRENMRTGTTDWNEQAYEFEVTDAPREIELVAELRATAGEVWFELESLRLEKR